MAYLGKGLGSLTTANITVDTMTGNGSATTMTITLAKGVNSVNDISAYVSGVMQRPGTDYTLSGSTLTFTTAPANGLKVVAISHGDSYLDNVADATVITESFADGAVTDVKVGSLSSSKLTGALPAGSATNLTNLNAAQLTGALPAMAVGNLTGITTYTKSASDPAANTNPTGGVGTLWVNSSSGEVYSCTDATANANVWTNVGAGTGDVKPFVFQGSIAGYTHGGQQAGASGYDTIDKFSYASQANATDVGNLAITMWYTSGASSGTHGYAMCSDGSGSKRTINKYSHTSDGNATDHGDTTSDAAGAAGCSDAGNGYGYVCGGDTGRSDKDKFSFSSNTTATDIGDLTVARHQCGGSSTATHGYVQGGINSNGSVQYDVIDRWSYAAGGNSSDVGNLTVGRYAESSGGSSATHGYTAGAYNTSVPWNVIDKYAFAASANATDVGDLTAAIQGNAVSSATNYGYSCGGQPPATVNRIEQISFTTDGNATDWADLTQSRVYAGTSQV